MAAALRDRDGDDDGRFGAAVDDHRDRQDDHRDRHRDDHLGRHRDRHQGAAGSHQDADPHRDRHQDDHLDRHRVHRDDHRRHRRGADRLADALSLEAEESACRTATAADREVVESLCPSATSGSGAHSDQARQRDAYVPQQERRPQVRRPGRSEQVDDRQRQGEGSKSLDLRRREPQQEARYS